MGADGETIAVYSIGITDEMRGDVCEIKLTIKRIYVALRIIYDRWRTDKKRKEI